jgi:phosphoglycolate phosphatase
MNLIFDLDGTLTDPESGITRCMVYTLEQLGLAAPDPAFLRRYIGPPLRAVFGELLATSDAVLIERAVTIYRERFGEVGLYENELYPETAESLEHLVESGYRLFVATAKAEVYARRILEHFEISQHFAAVYGAALSGEGSHKAELLARLIVERGIHPAESVMIGDRSGDIIGGRANRMRSIGVLWGYGTAEELANADELVKTWRELVAVLERMGYQRRS